MKKAKDFLEQSIAVQTERGQQYDTPEGERSFQKTATAFNAITGKCISAAEVALLLQILKDTRQWASGTYHEDSALDCVSYASLKAEELAYEAIRVGTTSNVKQEAKQDSIFVSKYPLTGFTSTDDLQAAMQKVGEAIKNGIVSKSKVSIPTIHEPFFGNESQL